ELAKRQPFVGLADRARAVGATPSEFCAALEPLDRMNRTERRYSQHLEILRAAGEVRWWAFEAIKLRLARRTWYTPDFLVELPDGELTVHEVKGHWEDDARVK